MHDIKSLLKMFKNEPSKTDNIPKFPLLLDEINAIISIIANCQTMEEANPYFDLLEEIQEFVAETAFVDNINIPNGLTHFVRDFDRIDDKDLREYLFNRIKNEHYILALDTSKIEELVFNYNARTDIYTMTQCSNLSIIHLAHLLMADIGRNINKLEKFLFDPSHVWHEENYSYLQKIDDKLFIGKLQEMAKPNAKVFVTNINQLNYILDRWEEALEKKPNKIIITKDDKGEIKVDFEN